MRTPPIVWLSLVFETLLALAGVGIGALFGAAPLVNLGLSPWNWVVGLLATLPLLVFLWWSLRTRWPLLARFRTAVSELLVPMFRDCSPAHLAIVALAAGIGEETLFRGALQPLAGRVLPETAALLAASVLFGLVHAVNGLYVFFASLFGLYLGGLLLLSGSLLPPIIAHAVYDFVALVALLGGTRREHLPSAAPILHNGASPSIPTIPQERDLHDDLDLRTAAADPRLRPPAPPLPGTDP